MSVLSINKSFGASVRKLRFRLGISQESLAERADLHRTYIADIERGARNITLRSIEKLAKALEVSTAELLFQTHPPNSRDSYPLRRGAIADLPDILLVDDNATEVASTLRAFRRAGIANQIHVARNGKKALDYIFGGRGTDKKLKQDPPPVILLDLALPKLGGMEVLARVKRNPKTQKIPVIVLAESRNSSAIQGGLRLGADGYMVKPIDFKNFSRITPKLSLLWALLHPALAPK